MPKKSFKERVWQQREDEILAEARAMMREEGFDRLNMDKVAERVGIAKPTLYQHFKSKDDLSEHIMTQGMKMLEAYLTQAHSESPREQLREIMRMILWERHAPDGVLTGLASDLVVTLVRHNPNIRAYKERIYKLLENLIERGKAQGELQDFLSPKVIATWMFCSSNVLWGAYADESAEFWAENLEREIDNFVNGFIFGIALPVQE
jgi:AcrR family transcriptional regulator